MTTETVTVQTETLNFIAGRGVNVTLYALKFAGRRVGYRVAITYPGEPAYNFHEDRRTRKQADSFYSCWKQRALD